MITEHFSEILSHVEAEYPREACGILAVVKGRVRWFPTNNVAKDEDDFVIDSKQYFAISRSSDIVGIVHSHPDSDCVPSESDIAHCNALGVPYYILSYPEVELSVTNPTNYDKPLMGREYKFGVSDCFEAMRDYYSIKLGIDIPPRILFEDDWWLKGLDYFSEEYVKTWGFNKVDEVQKGDLLIFGVNSEVGNHCGVYLGNEIIYHHSENRLSCRDSIHPFWAQQIIGVYRHVT